MYACICINMYENYFLQVYQKYLDWILDLMFMKT